jgi:hypothetical protein
MIVPCIQLAVTLNVSTHVLISHVEDTLAVASSTIGRNALVLTGSLEMRLLAANFLPAPNAQLILNVPTISHVYAKNVKTLVTRQPVDVTLNVKLRITALYVFA